MDNTSHLARGIIFLAHIMSTVDGSRDDTEVRALKRIRTYEEIPMDLHQQLQQEMFDLENEQILEQGIEAFSKCDIDTRKRGLAWLYKLLEADGNVDGKEAQFLLKAIDSLELKLNDVLKTASSIPDLL